MTAHGFGVQLIDRRARQQVVKRLMTPAAQGGEVIGRLVTQPGRVAAMVDVERPIAVAEAAAAAVANQGLLPQGGPDLASQIALVFRHWLRSQSMISCRTSRWPK